MAFTITLPSNASTSTFPDNSLSTFSTLLPEYMSLHTAYECSLLEVTCPTSWFNLRAENLLIIEGNPSTSQDGRPKNSSMTALKLLLNRDVANAYETDFEKDPLTVEGPLSAYLRNTANLLERGVEVHLSEASPSGGIEENYGVDAALGFANGKISEEQLEGVKHFCHIDLIDPIVKANMFGKKRKYRCFRLKAGQMADNTALIDYLNGMFARTQPAILTALRSNRRRNGSHVFNYDRFSMKCTISLPPKVMLKLPSNLAYQLGFGKHVFIAGKVQGLDVVDVNYRSNNIFLYSDVIENNTVGDKKVPLLRAITLDPSRGSTQTVSFQHLIYQPVACSSFKQITVYLRDHIGIAIPFERGQVTVVLAFRPIS